MIRMALAAAAVLIPVCASARDGVSVSDAYARSTNPKAAAVFMVIENHGAVECRLDGASSEAATTVELHSHSEEAGVMKMGKVQGGLAIPAGGRLELARGGNHVMMTGLTTPPATGDGIALVLDFGDCGDYPVTAPIDNQREPAAHKAH